MSTTYALPETLRPRARRLLVTPTEPDTLPALLDYIERTRDAHRVAVSACGEEVAIVGPGVLWIDDTTEQAVGAHHGPSTLTPWVSTKKGSEVIGWHEDSPKRRHAAAENHHLARQHGRRARELTRAHAAGTTYAQRLAHRSVAQAQREADKADGRASDRHAAALVTLRELAASIGINVPIGPTVTLETIVEALRSDPTWTTLPGTVRTRVGRIAARKDRG